MRQVSEQRIYSRVPRLLGELCLKVTKPLRSCWLHLATSTNQRTLPFRNLPLEPNIQRRRLQLPQEQSRVSLSISSCPRWEVPPMRHPKARSVVTEVACARNCPRKCVAVRT